MICNNRRSLPRAAGVWGCSKPPGDPGQSPGGGPGSKAPGSYSDPAVQSIKKCPPKHFLGTFLAVCCIQIEKKNSFKLKKFMCKANISSS